MHILRVKHETLLLFVNSVHKLSFYALISQNKSLKIVGWDATFRQIWGMWGWSTVLKTSYTIQFTTLRISTTLRIIFEIYFSHNSFHDFEVLNLNFIEYFQRRYSIWLFRWKDIFFSKNYIFLGWLPNWIPGAPSFRTATAVEYRCRNVWWTKFGKKKQIICWFEFTYFFWEKQKVY